MKLQVTLTVDTFPNKWGSTTRTSRFEKNGHKAWWNNVTQHIAAIGSQCGVCPPTRSLSIPISDGIAAKPNEPTSDGIAADPKEPISDGIAEIDDRNSFFLFLRELPMSNFAYPHQRHRDAPTPRSTWRHRDGPYDQTMQNVSNRVSCHPRILHSCLCVEQRLRFQRLCC